VLLNVTDAVAVGLNFDHVKFLNSAAVADMDPLCCSFHTNSPKIPESSSRHRPRPSKFHPPPNLSKTPSRLAKEIFFKMPTEWYYVK
jgi:hypothetical protein